MTPGPTPRDVKDGITALHKIADGDEVKLHPIEAEALIRHINSLYIKGFNFGLRSMLHVQDLAKERAELEAAGFDTDEDENT